MDAKKRRKLYYPPPSQLKQAQRARFTCKAAKADWPLGAGAEVSVRLWEKEQNRKRYEHDRMYSDAFLGVKEADAQVKGNPRNRQPTRPVLPPEHIQARYNCDEPHNKDPEILLWGRDPKLSEVVGDPNRPCRH